VIYSNQNLLKIEVLKVENITFITIDRPKTNLNKSTKLV
jgi:hypothetical protein